MLLLDIIQIPNASYVTHLFSPGDLEIYSKFMIWVLSSYSLCLVLSGPFRSGSPWSSILEFPCIISLIISSYCLSPVARLFVFCSIFQTVPQPYILSFLRSLFVSAIYIYSKIPRALPAFPNPPYLEHPVLILWMPQIVLLL